MELTVLVTMTNLESSDLYTGTVNIAESELNYTLQLTFPFDKWNETLGGQRTSVYRERLPIRVEVEGQSVELTDEEYRLFYYLLKDTLAKIMGMRQRSQHYAGVLCVDGGLIRLKKEGLAALLNPKFGCDFVGNIKDGQKPN
jgi:hypothetical protein